MKAREKSDAGWPGGTIGTPLPSSQKPLSRTPIVIMRSPRVSWTESTSCQASTIRLRPANALHANGLAPTPGTAPSIAVDSGTAAGSPSRLSPMERPSSA